MHLIFTITQLKSVSDFKEDPYVSSRPIPRLNEPSSVFVEGDIDDYKFYYLDRMLNKRIIKRGRGYATEYLVKWKGYGPEHDTWRNVKTLEDAKDLVQDYEEASGSRGTDLSRTEAPTITRTDRQAPKQAPPLPTRQTLLEVRIPSRPVPKVASEATSKTIAAVPDSLAPTSTTVALRRSSRIAGA